MHLLTSDFLSLQSLYTRRFYSKMDGWLLGSGKPLRVKLQKRALLIKRSESEQWIGVTVLYNVKHWHLMCGWCGCRTHILHYVTDYRCRSCTKKVLPKKQNPGSTKAKRQALLGDYSMLSSTTTDRIAMRLQLESEGKLQKLISPVLEADAIAKIRYQKIATPSVVIEPLKEGRLAWVQGKYIWVDGHR